MTKLLNPPLPSASRRTVRWHQLHGSATALALAWTLGPALVPVTSAAAGTVVIASLARDWRTALDRSLGRATRALTRSLRRQHRPVRGRTGRLTFDS